MQKYSLLWHSAVKMSQNGDILFVPWIGNFLLKIGRNILFAIGNMTQYQSTKRAKKEPCYQAIYTG